MGLKIRVSEITSSPSFGTRNVNADDGSDLYTTADSLLDNVSQGLSALSSTNCFDGSNDMCSTAKLKLDWAKSINKEWKDNFVLPLDYAKLVQEIKDDKSLSPTEKAEKIAVYMKITFILWQNLLLMSMIKYEQNLALTPPKRSKPRKNLQEYYKGLILILKQ